jgi:uncharacterized protein YjbI with pentapeptide repeats
LGRKLRRSIAIPTLGVIVAIKLPIPQPDGEHPQFAGAMPCRYSSRSRRLPAGRLTGSVGPLKRKDCTSLSGDDKINGVNGNDLNQGNRMRQMTRWQLSVIIAFCFGILIWITINIPEFPKWSGINGKTAWDLAELLIIPLFLAMVAYYFNRTQKEVEQSIAEQQRQSDQKIANDRLQENELQTFYDRMTELLLDKNLRSSGTNDEVRSIARTRTITTLRNLDENRRGFIIQFLFEAGLINQLQPIIALKNADLRRIVFSRSQIHQISLEHTIMTDSTLYKSVFQDVNFSKSDLSGAKFDRTSCLGCNFDDANLSKTVAYNFYGLKSSYERCNFSEVDFTGANLVETKFNHANMESCVINHAQLFNAELVEAVLRNAKANKVNLQNAKCFGANFDNAELHSIIATNAEFRLSSFRGAILEKANFQQASLVGAQLQGAKLRGANLVEADLKGANLSGADLTDADLTGAILSEVIADEATIWPENFEYRPAI